jgi:hypothetical protein
LSCTKKNDTGALSETLTVITAPGVVSKSIASSSPVVVVTPSIRRELGCVNESPLWNPSGVGFAMVPVATDASTTKLQERFVRAVSHVHETRQWPPLRYSM